MSGGHLASEVGVRRTFAIISDTWLKANHGKARASREEKMDRDGFGVRVTPNGKITFQIRYRYGGKNPKRLDVGSYPLMSLKEARLESQRLRAALEQGHDPKIIRLLEKQEIIKADSVESLYRQWHKTYCEKNKKGHHEILRSFELYVFPKIGKLPAAKVTLHEWLKLLEEQAQLRPGIADRILTNAKQMLKWGV
ncbi:MAG TPA: Arm DNA-binding domain-containing protein, partial [Spongiibacteraceae bacterium]